MGRRLTSILSASFMLGGFLLSFASYMADSRTLKPVIEMLSPSQTNVFIQVSSPVYSALIFVGGAFFSTGLSMLVSLLNVYKESKGSE